jgi:hypothetical protein
MTYQKESGIWAKVNPELVVEPSQPQAAAKPATSNSARRTRKVAIGVLDVIASAFWLYILLKLFVFDVDSAILGGLAHYRFFFFVAGAVWIVILFRTTWLTVAVFAYIGLFPLVVVGWKLPRVLYKTRSSIAALAAVNALTSLVADLRHSIVIGGATAFLGLVIAVSHSPAILAVAGAGVVVLLVEAIYRTIRLSVGRARFLRLQQAAIRRVVSSKPFQAAVSPGEELLRADVVRFNEAQQTMFVQRLGTAVIVHRVLDYWSYQLDTYRRSAAPLFFNALSYIWLVVRVVLGLTFLNLALYHANPAAFSYHERPSFLVFLRYVVAALSGSEIEALHAKNGVANAISLATTAFSVLVLSALVASSALGYRSKREDAEITQTMSQLHAEGQELEERLAEEFEVSLPEAVQRLEELKFGLLGVITFLSSRLPKRPSSESSA